MTETDDDISVQIRERLNINPDLDPRDIRVTVESGIVTLGGSVRSRREKQMAAEAAAEVQGVLGVDNHLHVAGPGEAVEGSLQGDTERPDGLPPLDRHGNA